MSIPSAVPSSMVLVDAAVGSFDNRSKAAIIEVSLCGPSCSVSAAEFRVLGRLDGFHS